MWLAEARTYLFPAADERSPGFRAEIESSCRQGLRIIGSIQIAVSIFMLAARFLVAPGGQTLPLRSKQAALIVALGLLDIGAAALRLSGGWLRLVAVLSAIVTAGTLIWASLVAAAQSTSPNDFIPGQITLVLLVTVTIIPLRPLHTLFLGAAILSEYITMAAVAEQSLLEGLGPDQNYVIFIVMLTLLSVGITAVLYAQRW